MTRVQPTTKTVLSHTPVLNIIFQTLNPNVAADSWSFHFKRPSLHLNAGANLGLGRLGSCLGR